MRNTLLVLVASLLGIVQAGAAEPQDVVQRFLDAWCEEQPSVLAEALETGFTDVITSDFEWTWSLGSAVGQRQFEARWRNFRSDYPKCSLELEDRIVDTTSEEIRKEAVRGRFRASHEPTGRQVNVPATILFHVRDGRITAAWGFQDDLVSLVQLGTGRPAPPRRERGQEQG